MIRRAYAAFGNRDLEALIEISDEEIEVYTVTGMLAGHREPYRGYPGLAQYLTDLTEQWKRLELQPQSFHPVGEGQVLVFGRVRAWHESGFLDSQNAWLWTLVERRVRSVRVYADPNEARAAFKAK